MADILNLMYCKSLFSGICLIWSKSVSNIVKWGVFHKQSKNSISFEQHWLLNQWARTCRLFFMIIVSNMWDFTFYNDVSLELKKKLLLLLKKQSFSLNTVWKLKNFCDIQNLREINLGRSRMSKKPILTNFEALPNLAILCSCLFFETLDMPKLISRKILEVEKFFNFYSALHMLELLNIEFENFFLNSLIF